MHCFAAPGCTGGFFTGICDGNTAFFLIICLRNLLYYCHQPFSMILSQLLREFVQNGIFHPSCDLVSTAAVIGIQCVALLYINFSHKLLASCSAAQSQVSAVQLDIISPRIVLISYICKSDSSPLEPTILKLFKF